MHRTANTLNASHFVVLAAAAVLGLHGCAAEDAPDGYATQTGALTLTSCDLAPAKAISVPSQCPTIKAALNHAASGAVITVAAGTYSENLTISKIVTISGAGTASTKIQGPSSSLATIRYTAAGGGTLSGLSVLGGAAAVEGGEVTLAGVGYPSSILLKNLKLTTTPYGLKGYFSGLSLDGVVITKATKGAAAIQSNAYVTVGNSMVSANSVQGFAVKLVGAGPPSFSANNSTFSGNGGTGLKITTAGLGKASFKTVTAADNAGDGIDCTGITTWTTADQLVATGNLGNGVRISTTDQLWLFGGPFSNNGKSGVSVYASKVWFADFSATNNALFGLDLALAGAGSSLSSVTASSNQLGGLRLSGSAGTASVSGLVADSNRMAGVLVQNFGKLDISSAKISNSLPQASTGKFGDGIYVVASNVKVSNSTLLHAARAGISVFGCNGTPGTYGGALVSVSATLFVCPGIDIDQEQGSGGWTACPAGSGKGGLDDAGGNYHSTTCSPNPATPYVACSGTCPVVPDWGPVKAQSGSLEPITELFGPPSR